MSNFCPECGVDCTHHTDNCPDCQFPLSISLLARERELIISSEQQKRWNRIAQLLRRNGLTVTVEPKPRISPHWWWALPGSGLLVFMFALFFGGPIANKIWPPPPMQFIPALQLGEEDKKDEEPSIDTTFLTDALRVSGDQDPIEDDSLDVFETVNRIKVDYDEIRRLAEVHYVEIKVEGHYGAGVYVSENGLILTTKDTVAGAFVEKDVNVQEGTSLIQKKIVLLPDVSPIGGPTSTASLIQDSVEMGVALLSSESDRPIEAKLEFEKYPSQGESVWIGKMRGGAIYPEEATLTKGGSGSASYMPMSSSLQDLHSGSPVFNEFGELIGMLAVEGGGNFLIPFRSIRESAPFIYRELMNSGP
ncbi:MAG: trypsin-like peptidase domain-containing protein [Acidobacteria bacterium]|nr:trypsin-like peptidase domain-containing protein [Acidobacteriota bacterium]